MQEHGYEGFEYPPETNIEISRTYVEEVLHALGWAPEQYWLSDEGIIADLVAEEEDFIKAKQLFGFEFSEGEFVWEVAARLKPASQ